MRNNLLALIATLFIGAARADFNFTTCPGYWETQRPGVAENFNIEKLVGTYYELALHDYTQYPTCPKPSCIRSHKEWTDDAKTTIKDTFTLGCFGHFYDVAYFFNRTEDNGSLKGFLVDPPIWWTTLFGSETVYPDTVVAFKESEDGGQYDWVVEFQCRTKAGWIKGEHVGFTGINFYSRVQNPTDDTLNDMLQAARDAGLGVYMDASWGTINVPQTDCNYPTDESASELPLMQPLTN